MKARYILALALIVILFEACHPPITAYEAANNPRGRKCRVIK